MNPSLKAFVPAACIMSDSAVRANVTRGLGNLSSITMNNRDKLGSTDYFAPAEENPKL